MEPDPTPCHRYKRYPSSSQNQPMAVPLTPEAYHSRIADRTSSNASSVQYHCSPWRTISDVLCHSSWQQHLANSGGRNILSYIRLHRFVKSIGPIAIEPGRMVKLRMILVGHILVLAREEVRSVTTEQFLNVQSIPRSSR